MMDVPRLNISGMERQVARCAVALLPAEANGLLVRQVAPVRNGLGDPLGVPPRAVRRLCVYLIPLREWQAVWMPVGMLNQGGRRGLIAYDGRTWRGVEWGRGTWGVFPWGGEDGEDLAMRPGDVVMMEGRRFRIMDLELGAGAGEEPPYWEGRMEEVSSR